MIAPSVGPQDMGGVAMNLMHPSRSSAGGTPAPRGGATPATKKASPLRALDFAAGEAALAPDEQGANGEGGKPSNAAAKTGGVLGPQRQTSRTIGLAEPSASGAQAREASADPTAAAPMSQGDEVSLIRERIAEMDGPGKKDVAHFEALMAAAAEIEGEIAALQELLKGTIVDAYLPMAPPDLQPQNQDPLVVDLDGDGVEFVSQYVRLASMRSMAKVYSDFGHMLPQADSYRVGGAQVNPESAGYIDFYAWVGGDDGLLVYDRNQDGEIQAEDLFGDKALTGRDVANGFEDLALLDANQDGVIDPVDPAYKDLRVWKDASNLGDVDPGELLTLPQAGIAELNLACTSSSGTPMVGEEGSFTPIGAHELEAKIAEAEAKLATVQPTLAAAKAKLPLSASLVAGFWVGGKPILAAPALESYVGKLRADLVTAGLASQGASHSGSHRGTGARRA